jgi:hypothetical protein
MAQMRTRRNSNLTLPFETLCVKPSVDRRSPPCKTLNLRAKIAHRRSGAALNPNGVQADRPSVWLVEPHGQSGERSSDSIGATR